MFIAIVDDDILALESLSDFLLKSGHEILALNSSEAMYASLQEQGKRIDILISDVCMPGMNGTELLQKVRELGFDIDVILITGFAHSVDSVDAVEFGACGFLQKPLKLRELEVLVGRIEEQRKSRKIMAKLKVELEGEREFREESIKDRMFARRLHNHIFPKNLNWLTRSRALVRHLPMAAVGGDYVDLRPYGQDRALLIVADVSGHGTPAAFGGIALKTWFSSIPEGLTTCEIMSQANDMIFDLFPDEFFATAFCAIYDEMSRELKYCIAGHPNPFILSPNGASRLLVGDGPALGIQEKRPASCPRSAHLSDGEILFSFTDGLTHNSEELLRCLLAKLGQSTALRSDLSELQPCLRFVLDSAIEMEPLRAFSDDLSILAFGPEVSKKAVPREVISGKTILVYDDDESTLHLVSEILQTEHAEVIVSTSALNCLEDVERDAADLVIMDIQMPDVNGLRALADLRNVYPRLPVMIMSGHDTDENLRLSLQGNAAGFAKKGIPPDEILKAVESALNFQPESERIEFDDLAGDWMDFVISSSRTSLEVLGRYLESLTHQPIPPAHLKDVIYCIKEMAGNAIEWGNLHNPELKVRISTVILPDKIMIKVVDEGAGFNAREALEAKDLETTQAEREQHGKREGGFGLSIVQSLMDSVTFNKRGNAVMMCKSLTNI
ncbi:hypothetical protein BVY04_03335 [bacterium M21]|nr:hypothetical protein BVY04_03335 [bacterium M21]